MADDWRVKQKQEHFEKYDALAAEIGIARIIEAIPFSADSVRRALDQGDEHLNSLPMKKWDQVTGYAGWGVGRIEPCPTCGQKRRVKWSNRDFRKLPPFEHGPHTPSERVCLLKHVAKHYLAKGWEA